MPDLHLIDKSWTARDVFAVFAAGKTAEAVISGSL
jgi:hypothetical protein